MITGKEKIGYGRVRAKKINQSDRLPNFAASLRSFIFKKHHANNVFPGGTSEAVIITITIITIK